MAIPIYIPSNSAERFLFSTPILAFNICRLLMMSILTGVRWYLIAVLILNQIRSVAHSCPTLCDPMNRSTPGLPVHHQLPEFTETHVHRVSDAIQPSHPLLSLLLLPPIPPSIRVFSNESTLCMMWPKSWSFSFSIILKVNSKLYFSCLNFKVTPSYPFLTLIFRVKQKSQKRAVIVRSSLFIYSLTTYQISTTFKSTIVRKT